MSKVELDVLFKKQQKDDKKEVLEFHILGENVKFKSELMSMAGGIANLEVKNIKLSAEFKSVQKDNKKTVLKFEAKGDNDEKMAELYAWAGSNVKLTIEPSQMSLEDFNNDDEHEGVGYNVNNDGTVEVAPGQLSIEDDVPFADPEETSNEDELLD